MTPIIIVGVPRSGTTLLRVLLDSHTSIAGAPETPWITGGYSERSLRELIGFLDESKLGPVSNLSGLDSRTLIEAGRLFLDRIFDTYLKARNKAYLVLKTPDDIENLEFLLKIYPDARFIYIHRDGRDVACSTYLQKGVGFGNELAGYGELEISSALRRWHDWDEKARTIFRESDSNYLNISYENMVQEPERVLSEVAGFIGVPYEPGMLNYADREHEYPEWEAGSTDVSRKRTIDTGSIGQWRQRIPGECWPQIDKNYGRYLQSLGYPLCHEFRPGTQNHCADSKPAVGTENPGRGANRVIRPGGGGFNLKNQANEYFGPHRSGWAFAVQSLLPAHDPGGIYLNTFLEKTFVWDPKSAVAIDEPWVGFVHIPPGVPDWFMGFQSNDAMFGMPQWQESMPHCRGLFTLSEYHRANLAETFDVPVNSLLHPAEIPELQWSWDRYERNTSKSIVQVGWWLRVLHGIFELPETGFEKIFLRTRSEEWFDLLMQKEREIRKKKGLFNDSMYDTARVVNYLSAIEYDRLLSENIVFVNFYDTSANNAIIECIARGTPVLVNPLDAVVEYLGETYPLYYNSFEEAAEKAKNPSLIYAAHQYLKELSLNQKFSGDYFRESLLNSEIMQAIQKNADRNNEVHDGLASFDKGPQNENLSLNPAQTVNRRGEHCFESGDLGGAEACFLEAIQTDPELADGYNNLGVLYWQKGDAPRSLEYLSKGLRVNADHHELIINTAEILRTLGEVGDAAALCEGYLVRNPGDDKIRELLTELAKLSGAGYPQGSDGSKLSPSAEQLNLDGEQAYLQGDLDGAETLFSQAYRSSPDNVEIINNLVVLYWQKNDTEKAVKYLAKALDKDPYNKDVVVNGGEILVALGRSSDAEHLFRSYLVRFPEDLDVIKLLSSIGVGTNATCSRRESVPEFQARTVQPASKRDIELLDYSKDGSFDRAPQISVVIPSLNQGEFLEKAIVSVLDQCYPNIELVVMDGGSTDGSVEIIEQYADRISYWQSRSDGGHYPAISEGFSRCHGEIMTWLDSDDIFLPGAFEKVASVFAQAPHVDWLTGIPNTIGSTGEPEWVYPRVPVYCQHNYLAKKWAFPHPIQQQGTFWRRSLWEKAGGHLQVDLKKAGDLELWARFFRQCPLFTLQEQLASFRQQSASTTPQLMSQYHKEADSILEREIDVFKSSGKASIPAVPPLRLKLSKGQESRHEGAKASGHGLQYVGKKLDLASDHPNAHQQTTDSGELTAPVENRLVIATSIAPKGLKRQKRAIQSWIELGFEVLSLNIQKEIDCLENEFPEVKFIQAKRHGTKVAGKPYVYIDDILAALAGTGSRVVGIVNSDIILRADRDIIGLLCRAATGSFLYGSRLDIEHETASGRLYHRGVDFFFFDASLTQKIPPANFMLGMPWWDWWLPISAIRQGVEVKRIDSALGYHVTHELNYSNDHMMRFAEEFGRNFKDEPFVNVYRECIRHGGNIDRHRMTIMADLASDYLARNSQRIRFPVSSGGAGQKVSNVTGRPRITAIVSTYESEQFIGDCLEDLTSQSISDQIEIIVIDASSPQDERAVVQRFQEHFPNIRYHRTSERIGIYAAWNLAVEMARGEYLITCSTNDRLRLDACEILARTLDEDPDVALVYGNSFMTRVPFESFDNPTLCGVYVWPEYSYESLTDRCLVGPHPMWRKSVHETAGYFNEDLVALGDQEFWLRIGEQYNMRALPDFTGLYLVSETSITGNTDLTQTETDRIHAKYRSRYRYGKWFSERYARDGMDHRCADGPLVQVVVVASRINGDRLADTLDSVAAQLYENWHLTIVSLESCPDPLFEQEPRLNWVTFSEMQPLGVVINRVVEDCKPEWLCVMDAGERLDPAFLSDCHDYWRKHPECKLVYCDDDCVDGNNDLFDPRFKPDFNLELLRGNDYIGNAFLVSYFAFMNAGGFGELDGALQFDLVLRVHDCLGSRSIGHHADMRFHRNDSDADHCREKLKMQRKRALQQHLDRRGELASVENGALPESFMLNYPVPMWPKVSVLVVATEKGDYLQSCLQAVLNNTDYPDFEVRVLDQTGDQSDSKRYLARLSAGDSRVTLIQGQEHNKVQDLNRVGREAAGEYLVWLNEEVAPVQENWLKRLVQHGNRDAVGVVGARIVNRRKSVVSGGILLGVGTRGVGARCHEGLHISSPGYMGRAQLAQEMGAVTSLCMLVRKTLFKGAGGFDERLDIDLYRDIDLCLRIKQQQKSTIWTPFSTLIYLGDGTGVDGRVYDQGKLEKQVEYFQDRWLRLIASDPAHNRNLSLLRTDFAPEIHTVRAWDPEIDEKPRVLSFGVGSYGSWQYRVKQPLDALDRQSLLQRTHTPFVGRRQVAFTSVVDLERLQPDSLLMHNTMHDDFIEAMERYKRVNKAFIVFGQDDLMTALPSKNPFSRTVYKDMKQRVRKCLSLADRVVVTTEPLADALSEMAADIRVVPNYLDNVRWEGLESYRGTGRKPRVGWAGAQQHLGDLELLEEVVRETAQEVDWIFFGMCPEILRPFVKEVHQPVAFEEYPEKLATLNLDLALAPLEHNRFNECKSNLRLLEYGILGWPVIASDVAPYREAPICRVSNQPRAWISAIRERIHDMDACRAEGDLLRDWVRRHWLLDQHAEEWLNVLDPVQDCGVDRRSPEKAAGL